MPTKQSDETLLKEIRDRFDRCVAAERDIRLEGELDMRALSVDGPWDPVELKARRDSGRPRPHHDQLRQHRNKLIGELRLNKRAIEISPKEVDTNDETARLTAGRVREIEYESNATDAYRSAFESMCDRGYGYFRITTAYVDEESTDLKIRIKQIANPDSVYLDPDAKDYYDPDVLDSARYAFVLETIPVQEFKRRHPKAKIQSFGEDDHRTAPAWIRDESVQVGEYWVRKESSRRKLILEDPNQSAGRGQYEDELEGGGTVDDENGVVSYPDGRTAKILRERQTKRSAVCQYITNGVEILEVNQWPGRWIPIIPMLGPEQWSTVNGQSKRMLYSLVRMARSPQMSFDFALANEEEVLGMTPKVPWIGYKGQFVDPHAWATAHKIPRAFLETEATTEATGDAILPPPQRAEFEPYIQNIEIAKNSFSMAIQNAIGMPSAEHKDRVAKSGKALEAIDRESDLGTFHFIDNHDRAVQFAGRQIDDLLPKIEDTERDVTIREADGKTKQVRLYGPDEKGRPITYGRGRHEVTVSVGPNYQSERQRVEAALETLLKTLPPELSSRFIDLVVKLMNFGPIGDQIIERITPPEFRTEDGQQPVPPEAAAKLQEQQAIIEELKAALQELQFEKEAKAVEAEGRLQDTELKTASAERIAGLKAGSDQKKTETQSQADIVAAEIKAQVDLAVAELRAELELDKLERQREIEELRLEHAEYTQEREIASRPPDTNNNT